MTPTGSAVPRIVFRRWCRLAGFRVVRPDLPGAGRSPTPPQDITVRFLVEMLESAAAHLGVHRAHVVGHSFHTLIAQHLAAPASRAGCEPDLVRTDPRTARRCPRKAVHTRRVPLAKIE